MNRFSPALNHFNSYLLLGHLGWAPSFKNQSV
jgi:hypothetical protein